MQNSTTHIAALVDLMPEVDQPGQESKATGPKPETAEKIFAEILSGGKESLRELLALVREPGDEGYQNYKPSYVVHGLVTYVGHLSRSSQQGLLTETLVVELDNPKHSKAVKGFLIRELQVIGGRETIKALGQHLLDEDLGEYATQALLAIGGASGQFRAALPKAKGKNRITLLQALGVSADKESVPAFKQALNDDAQDARLAAAWGLAKAGDAGSADILLKLADGADGWERTKLTQACLLLAENLRAAGQASASARIYKHFLETRKGPDEQYLREIAEKALKPTST